MGKISSENNPADLSVRFNYNIRKSTVAYYLPKIPNIFSYSYRILCELYFRPLRQTTSWERQKHTVSVVPIIDHHRAFSCDTDQATHAPGEGNEIHENDNNWSSDSEDDEHHSTQPVCTETHF